MPSLDVRNPGMPDLQFVLFVSALCTADLPTLNLSPDLRREIFDRLWALVNTDAPPADPRDRVLDLRSGTELTLDACVATIRTLLAEAGITSLTWDHPPSDPTQPTTPAAAPLIERIQRLYPEPPDLVDPDTDAPPRQA